MKKEEGDMYSKRDERFFEKRESDPDREAATNSSDTETSSRIRAAGDFPLEALPRFVRDYVLELARFKRLAIPAIAMGCLSVLSGALGSRHKTRAQNSDEDTPVNLLVVIASGTKSGKSVLGLILNGFKSCEAKIIAGNNASKTSQRLNLHLAKRKYVRVLKEIQKAEEVSGKLSPELVGKAERLLSTCEALTLSLSSNPRFILHRVTGAKLRDVLSDNGGRAFICSLDGSGALLNAFKGSDGLLCDLLLSGFMNEICGDSTSSSGEFMGEACLSGFFAIQPYRLHELLFSKQAAPIGLTNRICIVDTNKTEPRSGLDKGAPCQEVRAIWETALQDIFTASIREGECEEFIPIWNEACCSKFDEFEQEMERVHSSLPASMLEHLGREREMAIRIGGILLWSYKLSSTEFTLSAIDPERSAESAIKIVRWLALHRIEIQLAEWNRHLETRMAKLKKALRKHGGERLGSLLKDRNGFSEEELDQLLKTYPDLIEKVGSRGSAGPQGGLIRLL